MLLGDDFLDLLDKIGLIRNNDNIGRKVSIRRESLSQINDSFIILMKSLGIRKINLTSIGNSIATGYAVNDSIIPFLLRNDSLISKAGDIDIKFRSYARGQDNNEEHVFEWYLKNYTQSDINKMVDFDFTSDSSKAMDHRSISKEDALKYYPIDISDDIGLQDLIAMHEDGLANIVVYNGCTASFLDNWTRKGRHKGLHGFGRDFENLNSFLQAVYLKSPYTQVYVCGIPHLGNLKTIYALNNKMRKICKKYSNCVFIESVSQNFAYKHNDKTVVDIHYNQDEYLHLLEKVFGAIVNNYVPVVALTDFDLSMKSMSRVNEFMDEPKSNEQVGLESFIYMSDFFSRYNLTPKQLKKIQKYFLERYPHDYFHTDKYAVKGSIDLEIQRKKR